MFSLYKVTKPALHGYSIYFCEFLLFFGKICFNAMNKKKVYDTPKF